MEQGPESEEGMSRPVGFKHSEETKKKMRESGKGKNTGNVWSEEQKKHQSDLMKGVPKSEEHKRKIGEAHKGRVFTEERRKQMSESRKGKSTNAGWKMSEQQIELIRARNIGRKRSEEDKLKQSLATKGVPKGPMKEETKKKLAIINTGKVYSMESRIKHSCTSRGIPIEEFDKFACYVDYCPKFNFKFKERVREFFGRVCVECGKPESENPTRLCVHHVNYKKEACCDSDIKWLFVALCSGCHSKTHYNRKYWEGHFTEMINKKYGGSCYLPKTTPPTSANIDPHPCDVSVSL